MNFALALVAHDLSILIKCVECLGSIKIVHLNEGRLSTSVISMHSVAI
jgi:hypothetical protein